MKSPAIVPQDASTKVSVAPSLGGRGFRKKLIRDMESTAVTLSLLTTNEQHQSVQEENQSSIKAKRKNYRETYRAAVNQEEMAILRECVYALSGISGERFAWKEQHTQINIPLPPRALPDSYSLLGSGSQDAMAMCAYAGILYQSLSNFANALVANKNAGSIGRAIGTAVQHELVAYRTIIANQRQEQDNMVQQSGSQCLREMIMETNMQSALWRLRSLSMIMGIPLSTQSESTMGSSFLNLHGSEWITHLNRHLNHGDTRHCNMVQDLLKAATRPWFQMLYTWTMEGILIDSAQEFFVVESASLLKSCFHHNKDSDNDNDHFFLWHKCYQLDHTKVPHAIIENNLVNLVFIVGKGVNYIRKCLQDVNWSLLEELQRKSIEDKSKTTPCASAVDIESTKTTSESSSPAPHKTAVEPFHPSTFGFSYMPHRTEQQSKILRSTLEKSATLVHSHILHSLKNDHALMQHLWALKQFLFLGQGDFFSSFVDGIQAEYGENEHNRRSVLGSGIYRHTLRGILESSIRSIQAHAEFSPNLLERLDVDVRSENDNEESNARGPTVWDVVALHYTVPNPITAIVHLQALELYDRMFSFLFRLRKIEYFLNYTWRQSSILQRALHANAQYLMIQVQNNREYAQAVVLLRQVAMTRQAMVHFVVILKDYLMNGVLETSWKRLKTASETAKTLDDVIAAHEKYLRGIIRKSLVRRGNHVDNWNLSAKLEELLSLVEEFCFYQQDLFQDALDAADRAADKRREAQLLVNQGFWGVQSEREVREQETCFGLSDTSKLIELDRINRNFNELVRRFLVALDSKLNGSPLASDETSSASNPFSETEKATILDEEDDDMDLLRSLASQLDFNEFYGVTSF